jgi:hypothetical protein
MNANRMLDLHILTSFVHYPQLIYLVSVSHPKQSGQRLGKLADDELAFSPERQSPGILV